MPGSGDTAVSPRAVQERQTLQSAVQRRPERVMRTRSARARDTACQQDESPWNVHPGTPESSWSQAGCQKHPPRRWLWPGWEALPRPRRQQYSRLGQAYVQGSLEHMVQSDLSGGHGLLGGAQWGDCLSSLLSRRAWIPCQAPSKEWAWSLFCSLYKYFLKYSSLSKVLVLDQKKVE